MPDVQLADIVSAADRKYGDLRIPDLCTLRNGLRLPKEQRRELSQIQDRIDAVQQDEDAEGLTEKRRGEITKAKNAVLLTLEGGEKEDETEAVIRLIGEAVLLVADTREHGQALLDTLGDDLPALLETFERYGEVSQPGEASPSAS